MLHPKLKQILGVLISLVLTAALLYLAFKGIDFHKVIENFSYISWFWVVLLAITITLSHFVRALRWRVMLYSVKKDTSIKNLFGALMVGYGVNCAIPRLGEITRAVLLGRWEGLSRTSMLGTVIVERVIDMIALAVSLAISVIIYSGDLYISFPWLKSSLYVLMLILAAAVFFLLLIIKFKEKFSRFIIKIVEKISHKLANKLAYIFEMLIDGFSSLKGVNNYLLTFGLTTLIMMNYALNSYLGFYTLHMNNIKPISYDMGWILMSISAIGSVIPTPGGTGSYHALAISVLVLLFGFGSEIAAAYAILTHAVSIVLFIVLSIILFYWLNHKYKRHSGIDISTIKLSENKK